MAGTVPSKLCTWLSIIIRLTAPKGYYFPRFTGNWGLECRNEVLSLSSHLSYETVADTHWIKRIYRSKIYSNHGFRDIYFQTTMLRAIMLVLPVPVVRP